MSDSSEREVLQERYEKAVRRAEHWMNEQGRSQAWLAEQLGVERSIVTRFLQGEPRYIPQPGRKRIMGILEGIERICREPKRDIFLSHSSKDKDFVRKLAADIESNRKGDRRLLTWIDEAQIRPGQSIPALVTQGIETSEFIGLVLTPNYFEKGSGWTDAEWHAALHSDPDNRKAKLVPLLVDDCPYVPALLRHLLMIDFREGKYEHGLKQLLRILRDEPLPRPVAVRGQLVESNGRIDRSTLIAELAVPEADPDVVSERAYCNLLPIERLPRFVYSAPIAQRLRKARSGSADGMPTKSELRGEIYRLQDESNAKRWLPAFRVDGDNIVTFHDLESTEGILQEVIEPDGVEVFDTADFIADPIDRNLVVSLLNMSIARHMRRCGLLADETRFNRFFFPPDDGKERVIEWIPAKNKAKRTVTKPYVRNDVTTGWMHHACYIKVIYLASRLYIHLSPTRLITEDGERVRGGPDVGRIVVRWLGQERNLHVLYNVRFWTTVLRSRPGPISVRIGDQFMEVAKVPAFIQQGYGIAGDQRDLMGLLDREASMISQMENAEELTETVVDDSDEDSNVACEPDEETFTDVE
ncbi:hypothetical protein A2264_03915 [candidate division WWE3 bacterium RIFOXYA2_FULL_46_9]|uniref:TIR domain-containing protein n=1 Tax=candidate division WWE3 bacterium RIFOXYA2_FULL_46_9 TaxID=1802636 RepID=A0A1F4VZY3_UNCKA|nr:MAG: hypothetical protein A2264_03915 [candidate division WWE3 bacterium RIFOXYA2_FULL_46_9]